jgi:hypothetical protein
MTEMMDEKAIRKGLACVSDFRRYSEEMNRSDWLLGCKSGFFAYRNAGAVGIMVLGFFI